MLSVYLSTFHKGPIMYKVINISSGIIAASFNDRQYALDWIADNNSLLGEPASLYRLIIVKENNK